MKKLILFFGILFSSAFAFSQLQGVEQLRTTVLNNKGVLSTDLYYTPTVHYHVDGGQSNLISTVLANDTFFQHSTIPDPRIQVQVNGLFVTANRYTNNIAKGGSGLREYSFIAAQERWLITHPYDTFKNIVVGAGGKAARWFTPPLLGGLGETDTISAGWHELVNKISFCPANSIEAYNIQQGEADEQDGTYPYWLYQWHMIDSLFKTMPQFKQTVQGYFMYPTTAYNKCRNNIDSMDFGQSIYCYQTNWHVVRHNFIGYDANHLTSKNQHDLGIKLEICWETGVTMASPNNRVRKENDADTSTIFSATNGNAGMVVGVSGVTRFTGQVFFQQNIQTSNVYILTSPARGLVVQSISGLSGQIVLKSGATGVGIDMLTSTSESMLRIGAFEGTAKGNFAIALGNFGSTFTRALVLSENGTLNIGATADTATSRQTSRLMLPAPTSTTGQIVVRGGAFPTNSPSGTIATDSSTGKHEIGINLGGTRFNIDKTGVLVTSSAGTLTLAYATDYIFTGTTTTWTLPAIVAAVTGKNNMITIKNRGSGAITLNTASGSTLYTTSAVSTLTINAGEAYFLIPDGTFINAK
jgi:hypothetical protein